MVTWIFLDVMGNASGRRLSQRWRSFNKKRLENKQPVNEIHLRVTRCFASMSSAQSLSWKQQSLPWFDWFSRVSWIVICLYFVASASLGFVFPHISQAKQECVSLSPDSNNLKHYQLFEVWHLIAKSKSIRSLLSVSRYWWPSRRVSFYAIVPRLREPTCVWLRHGLL